MTQLPPPPTLLTGATVLTCDAGTGSLLRGDVLIEGGRIAAVGETVAAPPGARVVDVDGAIVFPGLVDAHQHLWEVPFYLRGPDMGLAEYFATFVPEQAGGLTPDGLYQAGRDGLALALRSGTTTVFDWCHATNSPAHADAALSALVDSGARGLFGYGPPVAFGYYGSDRPHPEDLEAFVARHGVRPSARTAVAAALRGPDTSPADVTAGDIGRARELGLRISMHIGTRRSGPGGVAALAAAGLLGEDMQFVHTTDSTDEEHALVARSGGRIVVPPAAELVMGTGLPPLARLAAAGHPAAFGVDTALGAPADMFGQMRAALLLLRTGEWDGYRPPPASSCLDVLTAATLGGARACWLDDDIGSITPGKLADLVVLRPSRPVESLDEACAQVVWGGDAARIDTVLIEGREVW